MIAGVVRFDDGAVSRRELDRMKSVLALHGPDRQAVWLEGNAGLIHCMFETAPQHAADRMPGTSARGITIVANARLDNRPDLFAALGLKPRDGCPDSSLILAAHEKWGEGFAQHLIGDFSCALYDPAERRLVIATDAIGARPVYYHWDGRTFRFASALKGLFAVDAIPRALREDGLVDWLLRNDLPVGETIYTGLRQVPPAHIVTVSPSGIVATRYWHPRDAPNIRFRRADDYDAAFRDLFDTVVRAQTAASHPIGIMLSGGLDSQAIAATAAAMLGEQSRTLHSFTLVPNPGAELPQVGRHHYADERPKVAALASRYPNIMPEFVKPCEDDDLAFLTREFYLRDGPVRESPTFLQGYRSLFGSARSRGVRVMLNGAMGNHTISRAGDERYLDLFMAGRFPTLWREVLCAARFQDTSSLDIVRRHLIPRLIPEYLKARLRGGKPEGPPWSGFSFIAPETLGGEAGVIDRLRRRANAKLFLKDHRPQERSIMRICERNAGYGTGSLFGDIELRSPAGDRRILEFCFGLPTEAFQRDGIDRRLVRAALGDRLPQATVRDMRRGRQNIDWIERASRLEPAFIQTIGLIDRLPIAARLLDRDRLADVVGSFDPAELRGTPAAWMLHLQGSHNTMTFTHFLAWFEGKNELANPDKEAELT